ncbi:MAG TPA: alpha/beta fold hydrolase, partial [Burkholderiales bacterium]|nr:alpha/beta fold hydrolase [Burkholderiales bacterium]
STVRHDASLSYEFVHARRGIPGPPPLLVMLHGFGSNEGDLLGLVPYLDDRLHITSVRGPLRVEAGAYGWYRVSHTAGGPIVHEGEEHESRKRIARFIDEMVETHAIDPLQVYVLGFSQGASMALSLALTIPEKLRGTVALGGRVLREVTGTMAEAETIAGVPVFMAHGLHDDVVPIGRARSSREFLAGLETDLTYREYPTAHQISPDMLTHANEWLSERLNRAK